VAVYPILPTWSPEFNWGTKRAMLWDENTAKLARGWLSSRTPTQYLSLRSRNTPHRIDLAAGTGKMRAINQLGTPIHSLLVLDETGKFFAGGELASDSTAILEPISRDDGAKRISRIVLDNEPETPPALAGSDQDFNTMRARSRHMYGRYR